MTVSSSVRSQKTHPGRAGIAPTLPIFRIENHDEAYSIWRDAGARDRILVHIDAHHDMWWLTNHADLSIANYVCPALEEGIVAEVFWVIPDQSWATVRNRRHILRHARRIVKDYQGETALRRVERDRIAAVVNGKRLEICSLDSLPSLGGPILLDIDVDFLLIPQVAFGKWDEHSLLPWCWPKEFLDRLRGRDLSTDLVTIAYSVEGGYTPLRWKYLGEELELRLHQDDQSAPALEGMVRMRQGAEAIERGELEAAENLYTAARERMPSSAAPCFHLALLYLRMNRLDDARRRYVEALELDPSYRTAFNSAGLWCYWGKRYREAGQEFRRVLALDPTDAYAQIGLGRNAARDKLWEQAEKHFRSALEQNSKLVDGWRGLGKVLAHMRRDEEAIAALETSLRLALAGEKPLEARIATAPPPHGLEDPYHWWTYRKLARLYQRQGAIGEAIKRYRMSAGGEEGVFLRGRLALLYARLKEFKRSAHEVAQAIKRVPKSFGETSGRVLKSLQEILESAYELWLAR